MQDKINKQYNQLLEELELHYERGMMFSHQQTLDKIQAMKRNILF